MAKRIPLNALHQALRRGLDDLELPDSAKDYRLKGVATIKVDCTVSKLASTMARDQFHPDWAGVLAALIYRAGWLPEDTIAIIGEALAAADAGEVDETYLAAAKSAFEQAKEDLPVKPKKGQTRVNGKVELMDFIGAD